jgi:hypothetical protein
MRRLVQFSSSLVVALAVLAATAQPARAQEPKSAAPAKELVQVLTGKKMDPWQCARRIRPTRPGGPVFRRRSSWCRPATRRRAAERKLARNEFRDVYIELNSASVLDPGFHHQHRR